MNVFLFASLIVVCAFNYADAGAAEIVAAARSQIGVPYVFGGGNYNGKSSGGFDCSGLVQYAVYHGTQKILARTAGAQYTDSHCKHVPYGQHVAGDLVFFMEGGSIEHVGIMSGPTTLIHAPHTGTDVKEATVWTAGRVANVQRCF